MNSIGIVSLAFLVCNSKILIVSTKQSWWRDTIIYEVYIRSFKDSDGDGIGDLEGITSKLDYFVELGVGTIWITPFFKSPMIDWGYDVSDYFKIDPAFGTMEDFNELVREMKKRNLKLILDFVINHTSNEHPWFKKSVRKIKPYKDFYVWQSPKGFDKDGKPIPPNNWVSVYEGSAWEWNHERQQFYYHICLVEQPDLNMRNPAVKAKVKKIIKFWFDKGASGARFDAAMAYMEDTSLRDEPPTDPKINNSSSVKYEDYKHIYTVDQLDTYKFIHELRDFVDAHYNNATNDERILVPEVFTDDVNHEVMYYGNESFKMSHFIINFDFIRMKTFPTPKIFDNMIKHWLNRIPSNGVSNWAIENHDNYRTESKFNAEFVDIFLVTIMLLPGVPCIYYGQEIGMVNTKLAPDPIVYEHILFDQHLPARHPMQWDTSLNAGFTRKRKPWLSVNSDYWHVNVESQRIDPNSRLNFFKILSKLRKTKTLKYGKFKSYLLSSRSYAFTRCTNSKKNMKILVVMNLSFERDVVNLSKHIPNLPSVGKIIVSSFNIRKEAPISSLHPLKFSMQPLSVIVLKI